jgi:F-type H+-transporting ATPase subunit b
MLTFPPDITFVIQIVSFLVLWWGLKRLLFDRVLQVLDQREARTTGTRRAAAEMTRAADASAAEYERRIQEVRQALSLDSERARSATQEEERRILTDARQAGSADLARLRAELSRQTQAARPALAAEARALSARLFEQAVGRPAA